MKKIKMVGLLLLLTFVFSLNASAQYSERKRIYNHKNYQWQVGDRYDPSLAGIASFLVPGLGQIISGEPGRGVGFLVGYGASLAVYYSGAITVIESDGETGGSTMLIGLGSALTIGICSIVDAVRVAKVNNMSLRVTSSYFKIQPSIMCIPCANKISAGLCVYIDLN